MSELRELELPWGVRLGQTEERMRGVFAGGNSHGDYFADGNFLNPFFKRVKVVFDKFDKLFYSRGPFYRYEELRDLLGKAAFESGIRSGLTEEDKFEILMGNMGSLNESLRKLAEELKLKRSRVRNERLKSELERAITWLESFWEDILRDYRKITPAQVALQRHFFTQLRAVPRGKNVDDFVVRKFFEPLYLYRDICFREPSKDNFSKYLTCWELLLWEELYSKRLKGEGSGVAESKVRVLADEVEMLALWEEVAVANSFDR